MSVFYDDTGSKCSIFQKTSQMVKYQNHFLIKSGFRDSPGAPRDPIEKPKVEEGVPDISVKDLFDF